MKLIYPTKIRVAIMVSSFDTICFDISPIFVIIQCGATDCRQHHIFTIYPRKKYVCLIFQTRPFRYSWYVAEYLVGFYIEENDRSAIVVQDRRDEYFLFFFHLGNNTVMDVLDLGVNQVPVLNHGFVRLVQSAGDDQLIVDAARVSYASQKPQRGDAALIDYLMENRHTSPFEMVVFWFHVKMPIFIARQWVRHRTARMNEISGRYSVLKDEFYMPDESDLRIQGTTNKQGSGNELVSDGWQHLRLMDDTQQAAYASYENHLNAGISKEMARINLPLSTYTEMYWQIDLHNLFHFLSLRVDSHAQAQIRAYGEAILSLIEPVVPNACESWRRHQLEAERFSSDELRWLKETLAIDLTKEQNLYDLIHKMKNDPKMRSTNNRKIANFCRKIGVEMPDVA